MFINETRAEDRSGQTLNFHLKRKWFFQVQLTDRPSVFSTSLRYRRAHTTHKYSRESRLVLYSAYFRVNCRKPDGSRILCLIKSFHRTENFREDMKCKLLKLRRGGSSPSCCEHTEGVMLLLIRSDVAVK